MPAAGLYLRYCKFILGILPADPNRARIRERALRVRVARAEAEARGASRRLADVRERSDSEAAEFERARADRDRATRSWEATVRTLEQPRFRAAIAELGLDFRVDEVLRVAWVTAFAAAILIAPLVIAAVLVGSPSLAAVSLGTAFAAPIGAFLFVASYPEIAANRLRVQSLGKAPEAVNYMAMALRLSPSLDRAVAFAAENAEEPLGTQLRRVLWSVLMRRPSGIEDAFLAFAREWAAGDEDLKQALFTLRASSLERSDEARERALEKAREIAFAGTQRRMRDYAASLRGPTTALFALGVLLPMIIGAMLPLLSLGGLGGGAFGAPVTAGPNPALIVIALDVAFPAATAAFAWYILGRRPGTLGAPDIQPENRGRAMHAAIAAGLGIAALSTAWLPLGSMAALSPAWALAASLGGYLLLRQREAKRARDEIKALEQELPDALFLLGNRIAEGHPIEAALRSVAASMEGTEVARLFRRIDFTLQLTRGSLVEALFGTGGVLRGFPSRTVRAAMRLVVDAAAKDPIGAGRAIVDLSNHLRELLHLDREVRRELSPIVDAMKSTATFFGPLVLGVTAGMYVLLAKAFAGVLVFSLPPSTFLAAVAIYLVFTVTGIAYFATGIEHGPDPVEFRFSLGRSLPLALTTFTLALAGAVVGLGI